MGLLDSLLGSFTGGGTSSPSPLMNAALQLIQQEGGLPGIISKFEQGGLGAQAQSWVGNGANMPISASQIQQILGSGSIGQIAQQLGLAHGDVSSGLAQALPQIIDQLTPNGQIPANHGDMLAQALAMLSKRA